MEAQKFLLSRRSFIRKAGLAVAALAVAPVALEAAAPAVARANEIAAGDVITANVYCEPDEFIITNVAGIKKGYLTNPKKPSSIFDTANRPDSPVTDNATVVSVNADGTQTIKIPLVNTVFRLVSVDSTKNEPAEIVDTESDGSYITSLTIQVPQGQATYVFPAHEYATLPVVTGTKDWPINVTIGF